MTISTFAWCSPAHGDQEHDKCPSHYVRGRDGITVFCECPRHHNPQNPRRQTLEGHAESREGAQA